MKTDYAALVRDDRIHGSLYVDAGIFEEEMDRIFHRGWVFAGHESEVPAPGDWVTRRLGLEHYILVRGPHGSPMGIALPTAIASIRRARWTMQAQASEETPTTPQATRKRSRLNATSITVSAFIAIHEMEFATRTGHGLAANVTAWTKTQENLTGLAN